MRYPLRRFFSSFQTSPDSWLHRVRDDFRQLLVPVRSFPSSANGAPLHLLKFGVSAERGRAQSLSLLTHAAVFAAFALLAAHVPGGARNHVSPETGAFQPIPLPTLLLDRLQSNHASDGRGAGGGQNPIPATLGNLAPLSSIQLVKPSLPPKRETPLAVPPTILDPDAPPLLKATEHIGLPWMKDFTDSPGPGKGHTIGNSDGGTMGDSTDGPGGR